MNDWKEIKNPKDIESLLQLYGHFHDSCLREIHIVTRESVDKDQSMHFDGQLTATLLFQRQSQNQRVIEMKFEEVGQFNFNPPDPTKHFLIIYEATFKKAGNYYYWASEKDWEKGDNDAVWISGERVFWREKPELIGQINRLNTE